MASIRERNGKFNVIYSYTDADGKRKQKWETYATKAEAKKRKKEIEYKEEIWKRKQRCNYPLTRRRFIMVELQRGC